MEFIFILVWLGIMMRVSKIEKTQRADSVCGVARIRQKMWFAILVFIPIIWMVAHRDLAFGDSGMYLYKYMMMPKTFGGISHYVDSVEKDKGFSILSCIIKVIFGNDGVTYFAIIALLQGAALVLVYRKYSTDYVLSIFMFVASTDYIGWMYNGLRQFTAVTTIFIATTLILNKKYYYVTPIILLASTFHRSALLMIPIVLIAQGRAWNIRTLIFIALAIIAVSSVASFNGFLDDALEDTQYANVVTDYTTSDDDGTNPLRVAVYSVPTILAFWGRRKIHALNDPLINFCTNMSLVSTGVYFVSMFTSGIFLGRIPIYASLYNYILLPWEIKYLFPGVNKMYVQFAMFAGYLTFYFFQVHFVWGLV